MKPAPTTPPLFNRYRSSMDTHIHLSHLLPYLPYIPSWQELADRILATHAMVRAHDCRSLGLGSPGPFELMIHGGSYYASLHSLWQGRPWQEWTHDQARSHLALVGQNGCGPDSAEDLYNDFLDTYDVAKHLERPVSLCYASLAELIIQPSGLWYLVSRHHTTVELLTKQDD